MALLAALEYLPVPLLLLSSEKTVILSNEAIHALFELNSGHISSDKSAGSVALKDKHIARLGIDVAQSEMHTSTSFEVRQP
jgi:hypothetical protein